MVYGQLVVTSNLICHYIRCDKHCLGCGAYNEIINYGISESPQAIQTWSLAVTSSLHLISSNLRHYTNMDYRF